MIIDINLKEMSKALGCGQLQTRTGLNQEQSIQRPKDTRWSSHYKSLKSIADMFSTIVKVLQELGNRFNETSSQLLECSASFSPRDLFCDFNVDKLLSLAEAYPHDFDFGDLRDLSSQLGLYIFDVRDDDRFSNIQTVAELSQKMVETGKHDSYPLVY